MLSTTHLSRAILPPSKKASPAGTGTGSTLLFTVPIPPTALGSVLEKMKSGPHHVPHGDMYRSRSPSTRPPLPNSAPTQLPFSRGTESL